MFGVRISVAALVFAVGCGEREHVLVKSSKQQPQESAAVPRKAVLKLAVDPNVLVTNAGTTVPVGLQQEIKRQFLDAVAMSGMLQEAGNAEGALVLREIGITKTETTKIDVDVTVDGHVNVKSSPLDGDAKAESETPDLGANVNLSSHVTTSSYTIAFAFEDRTPGADGDIVRVRLDAPLQVEENMRLASRVKLSFNIIKALPPNISMIVARFVDDISLSLDSGVAWEHASELSNRMFFRATDGKATALVRDFMNDVVAPICSSHASRHGLDASACNLKLPVIDNPVAALEKRFVQGVREARGCEATGEREGLTPIYRIYLEVPEGMLSFRSGDKVFVYEKSSAWNRVAWATVLGAASDRAKCGQMASSSQCAVVKLGAQWFEERCAIQRFGISEEDKPSLTL